MDFSANNSQIPFLCAEAFKERCYNAPERLELLALQLYITTAVRYRQCFILMLLLAACSSAPFDQLAPLKLSLLIEIQTICSTIVFERTGPRGKM